MYHREAILEERDPAQHYLATHGLGLLIRVIAVIRTIHTYESSSPNRMSRPIHPIRQDFIDKNNETKHIAAADRVFGY